jgi:PBP1b-binding outer membrane lipoprotein LpoB
MYYKQNPKGHKMKTTLITMLLALVLGGCVSAKYNPQTKEVSYFRFGDQKMSGVIIESYPDGRIDILVESQESEARLMQDAIGLFKAGMEAAKQ